MYRYKNGKLKLLKLIKQGYHIRFDKISDTVISYRTYINKDSNSIDTYFFENIYNWDTLKECNQALSKVEEHFDYINSKL